MTLFNVPPYLDWPAQFCLAVTIETWIHSLITANVSQVDRLWTFLPTIYTAYFALLPLLPNNQPFFLVPYAPKESGFQSVKDFSPRALLMLFLVVVWMFRLSYNTWRRGLFSHASEDYRWAVLRAKLSPFLFQLVNISFIAGIQNVLLLLLGLPTYTASVLQPHDSLALSDYILATIALTILAIEFTADSQQYAFHAYKHAYLAQKKGKALSVETYDAKKQWPGARLAWKTEDAERGFVTRGLWAYARHPNFACEQSFWIVITLFPLLSPHAPHIPSREFHLSTLLDSSARDVVVDYLKNDFGPFCLNLLPAASLVMLFFASTTFSEGITAEKYPAYEAYKKRVGMFAPVETLVWKKIRIYLTGGGKKELDELDKIVYSKKID